MAGQDYKYKSRAIGTGNPGQYTDEKGFLAYNEICLMLNEGGWTVKRDDIMKVPYIINKNQWISYDDVQSIKDKVEFLKSKELAGATTSSIDSFDFRGDCGDGINPLLKTIAYNNNNGSDCQLLFNEVSYLFIF